MICITQKTIFIEKMSIPPGGSYLPNPKFHFLDFDYIPFLYKLYTSKNPQKFTDFEGVVRFLIRQKIKSYSKKTENFVYFTYGGQYCPTHETYIGAVF